MLPAFFSLFGLGWSHGVGAETVELVTYLPTEEGEIGNVDPQFNSLRVGNLYTASPVPLNGQALVSNRVGIGIPDPGNGDPIVPVGALEVRGAAGQNDRVFFGSYLEMIGAAVVQIGPVVPAADEELHLSVATAASNPDADLRVSREDTRVALVASAQADAGFVGTVSNHPLRLAANNNVGISIEPSAGRVGIGPTVGTANYALDVASNNSVVAEFSSRASGTHSGVVIDTSAALQDSVLIFQGQGVTRWTVGNDAGDGNKLKFRPAAPAFGDAGANDVVTVQPAGRVGIGTTTPQATLDIFSGGLLIPRGGAAPTAVNGMIYYNNTAGEAGFRFRENGVWRNFPTTPAGPTVVSGIYAGTGSTFQEFQIGTPVRLEIWQQDFSPLKTIKWEKSATMTGGYSMIIADSLTTGLGGAGCVWLRSNAEVYFTEKGFRVRNAGLSYQPNRLGKTYRYVAYF